MIKSTLLLVVVVVVVVLLTACQPKGSYLYQYPKATEHEINQLMVVIDYLNLKDDVGKHWDFDSYYHQKILNLVFKEIDTELQSAGYPKANSYLLSSGLLINNQWAVEHYIEDQFQDELLYPPFILAKDNISEAQISQHQEILGILVKYMASRRHHQDDELSHRGMQLGYQMAAMDVADDTAILYVHIDLSAPGIVKKIGTFLLSGAIASQADYAHVHVDASPRRHASAFLVHKGSGQILWKNFTQQWTPEQPIQQLFNGLPKH